jgi:protein-L-isoaspartate(D-aspartate) O-methyltransferase
MGRRKDMARMLDDIRAEAVLTRRMIGTDELDERVMQAMQQVPRDAFVPEALKHAAFDNGPLPIGHGQTISQPYIVALMTHMIRPQSGHRVLEVGTGSGYQTAVLSLLCGQVFSVDVIPELVRAAGDRLAVLGYDNVATCAANGYLGWPEHAPYDGILVTAAATYIPPALIEQLRPGGTMAIPVGQPHMAQQLMRVDKDARGNTEVYKVLDVAFVPLVDRSPHGTDLDPS